ncbi:ras-responsive element-binding protein 1-like [Gigantopelta aegis]|uniref:ras-responsive element-binding protein 1-like n=1 Tax=Gigantopelta aegis TaxID=1735272 RepID=UPI001B88E2D3|nr:ras-responsive element-binding protein 1-like [Gigantopelta aegis]
MSRRKQANPRPLITAVEERGGQEEQREPSLSPSPSIPVSENEQDLPNCDSDLIIDVPNSVFPPSHLHQSLSAGRMMHPVYPDPPPTVSIIHPRSMSTTPSEMLYPPSSPPPDNPSSLNSSYSFLQPDLSKKSIQKILPVSLEDGNSCFICPVCQKELTTNHDLTVHIRSHNTSSLSSQANTCTICGKILSSQSSLDRHMLVHSGERPFKCKICKMSFTTNGNMHRHSRIHKKDDPSLQGVKGGPRKSKTKMFTKPEIHPALLPSGLHMEKFLHNAGFENQFGVNIIKPNSIMPDFKNYVPASINRIPMAASVPMMHNMYKGDNSEVFVKQEQDVPVTVGAPAVSTEYTDGGLHCPVCNKAFLCESELTSHMDSHPHTPTACNLCTMILPDPQSLSDHKRTEHSVDIPTSNQCEPEESIISGFSDLDFVNFSVSKFPLIAKSWCERNGRHATSNYHHFVCHFCTKAFPCKSALFLHMFIHNRKQLSTCPFCDCDFVGGAILHTHMLKHMSDAAISEAAPTMPHDIGKDHFLASLGIAAKRNLADVLQFDHGLSKHSNWLLNLEKRENVEYFEKLGQCFVPGIQNEMLGDLSVPGMEASPPSVAKGVKEEFMKDFSDFRNMVYLQAVAEGLPKEGGLPVWSAAGLHPSFPSCLSLPNFHSSLLSSPQKLTKESLTPGIHDDSPSLTSEESLANVAAEDAMDDGSLLKKDISAAIPKDVFPCKFCDMVFSNYRALKGHTRTHLGLSPYKCNLCNYSSADKSTLIRHLRTHNGERPFQCLICEFAFTTKANCERHVRKKHAKVMKKDIEDSIGYNKYVLESASMMDSFHSPDTVCKYCGIDFKFFRALKHHLRSHSSCRQKPFLCQKCDVGFSTKANCVRHLQKQHQEISQHQIESWIHVNEPSLLDDGDPSFSDGQDSASPSESCDNIGPFSRSPSPPVAHHSPMVEHLYLKEECLTDGGQPLDFSIKPCGPVSSGQTATADQPMDLSVKKPMSESSSVAHMVNSKSELSSLLTSPYGLDNRIQEKSHPFEPNNNSSQKLNKLLTSSDSNNNNNNSSSSHPKFWGMASILNRATPLIGYPGMGTSVLSQSLPARIKPPTETKIHSAFFRNFALAKIIKTFVEKNMLKLTKSSVLIFNS